MKHKELNWVHNAGSQLSLVVDDTERAWPGASNLILIEPYKYALQATVAVGSLVPSLSALCGFLCADACMGLCVACCVPLVCEASGTFWKVRKSTTPPATQGVPKP